MTAQPSSENTVLWFQRHCGLFSVPKTSAALSTTTTSHGTINAPSGIDAALLSTLPVELQHYSID